MSAQQTSDLLKGGTAQGHGRAYANGTLAYNGMPSHAFTGSFNLTAQAVSSGSTKAYEQNTKATESNTSATDDSTESVQHSSSVFDWVSRKLTIFANKTQAIADQITDYVSSAFKESRLKRQITAIENEISANNHAAEVYYQVADQIASSYEYYDDDGNKQTLSIPSEYIDKVQNGSWLVEEMDTTTEYGKNLAEGIQKYQEYYEKAEECSLATQDLLNQDMELYEELINMPVEKAEKNIERITNSLELLSNTYSSISTGGSSLARLAYQVESDAGMNQVSSALSTAKSNETLAKNLLSSSKLSLDTAKSNTKASIEAAKKAARNSGDSDIKDQVYTSIKNAQYIETTGLSGKVLTTAQEYNKALQTQREIQKDYNSKSSAYKTASASTSEAQKNYDAQKNQLSEIQQILLDNKDKPTYVIEYALLGKQLSNKRQESEEYEAALVKANKNLTTATTNRDTSANALDSYWEKVIGNSDITKYLNAEQLGSLRSEDTVDLTGITDQSVLQTLKQYNSLVDTARMYSEKYTIALNTQEEAAKNAAQSQIEYAQMAVSNEQSRFDNIKSYYDSKVDYQKSLQELKSTDRELRSSQGKELRKSDYESEIKYIDKQKELLELEKTKLTEQLADSVSKGVIKENTEEWYAMREEIIAVGNEVDNLTMDTVELQNAIINLPYEKLQKALDLYSAMASYLESIVSMTTAAGKYVESDTYSELASRSNDQYKNYKEQAAQDKENYEKALADPDNVYGGKSATEWQTQMYNNLANADKALADVYQYQKSLRELPLEQFTDELGNLESIINLISSESDLKEAQGHYLSTQDYQKEISATYDEIAKQEEINAQNKALYEDAVARNATADAAEYFDAWKSGETSLNNMQSAVEELNDKIRDDFVTSVKRAIDAIGDMRSVVESEISLKQAEGKYLDYSDYTSQISLNSQEYERQQQIMSDRYAKYTEALIAGNEAEADQMLSEAKQAEAAANNLLASNAELQKSIQDLFKNTLEQELDALDAAQKVLESEISLKEAQSRDLTYSDYQEQINSNLALVRQQSALARENQRLYESEVSQGNMESAAEYLKAWKEAEASANEIRATIEEIGDELRKQLLTKEIDNVLDRLEQFKNSISTISGIISDDMMYDSDGKLTEFGITALAMDIKQYESDTESLKSLLEKRQKYIDEYANGMNEYYSKNEFEEDMKSITSEIQDMLSDASSARQQIVEMVANTSKMEVDALSDVIDKRKELLKQQQSAYDFDKSLKTKTNDLTLLEKQKEALDGLTDKESLAKLQKLNKQIKEAQEDLADTITDHSYELKIDALDDLQEDISDAYEKYVEQLSTNLESITTAVTDATDTVVGSFDTVTDAINKLLNSYGVTGLTQETVGYTRQYAKGTTYHPGGSAIINDGDEAEMVLLPDGSILMPNLPQGSAVLNGGMIRNLAEMANYGAFVPNVKMPELNMTSMVMKESGGDVVNNIGDVVIEINDTVDPKNVLEVIHNNAESVAKDVGSVFTKNTSKIGAKKSWG